MRIRDSSYLVGNPKLVPKVNHGLASGCQRLVDLGSRVAVEHKDLPKMGAGGAEQLEPVSLGLGQRLFMAKDDASGVVLDLAQGDETAPLKWKGTVRWGESLGVLVDGLLGIPAKDALSAPV